MTHEDMGHALDITGKKNANEIGFNMFIEKELHIKGLIPDDELK